MSEWAVCVVWGGIVGFAISFPLRLAYMKKGRKHQRAAMRADASQITPEMTENQVKRAEMLWADVAREHSKARMVEGALTGWKRAGLGLARFAPAMGNHGTYLADDQAQCGEHYRYASCGMDRAPCVVPNKACVCGFHAARDRSALTELASDFADTTADLEVELSGRVLVFEHGYRAERQRVVSVRVDSGCVACDGRAVVLIGSAKGLLPVC